MKLFARCVKFYYSFQIRQKEFNSKVTKYIIVVKGMLPAPVESERALAR
jgi:hypothetical protein